MGCLIYKRLTQGGSEGKYVREEKCGREKSRG